MHPPVPQPSHVPGTLRLWEIPSVAGGFSYSANMLCGRQYGPCPVMGTEVSKHVPPRPRTCVLDHSEDEEPQGPLSLDGATLEIEVTVGRAI